MRAVLYWNVGPSAWRLVGQVEIATDGKSSEFPKLIEWKGNLYMLHDDIVDHAEYRRITPTPCLKEL